jgi:hypothetical protein
MWTKRIWFLMAPDPAAAGGAPAAGAAAGGADPAAAAAAGAGAEAKPAGAAGDAKPAPAFAETLPEAIRAEPAFKDIKDLDGLANGFLHAQKMLGHDPKNLVVMPGPDDKEGQAKLFNRLGRPEKADGYKFEGIKFPEGRELKPEVMGRWRAGAHELGLTEKQATGVLALLGQEVAGGAQSDAAEIAASLEAATANLKTKLGAAYEPTKALAMDALRHYATPEFVQLLENAKVDGIALGDHPGFVDVMGKMGKQLSEDGLIGKRGAEGQQYSPAEAKQQIAALERDEQFTKSYRNKEAPGHKEAVAKMEGLYKQAYPEEQATQ